MRKILVIMMLVTSIDAIAMTTYQKCDAVSTMVMFLFKMRKAGANEAQLREEAFTFLEDKSAAAKLTEVAMVYRLDTRVSDVKEMELKLCLEK